MPTLSNSFNLNSAAQDKVTLTTGSFTPVAGNIIVVKAIAETEGNGALSTPTDTNGHNYALQVGDATTPNRCEVWIWTTEIITGSSQTVSVALPLGSGLWHSVVVEHYTDAALAITPASVLTLGNDAPSTSFNTDGALSTVSWLCGDWAANSPAGRVYDATSATPVEDGLHDKSVAGAYVAYYATQPATSAGTQFIGLTAPGSQTWSMAGIEILDIPAGGASVDQNQANPITVWQ